MSFAYSVALVLSGGVAPFIATWLVDSVGQPTAPAYLTMLYGVIGLALMWPMTETNTQTLDR
jgi:MHS family proline/betaine transporter-like MFS transporter